MKISDLGMIGRNGKENRTSLQEAERIPALSMASWVESAMLWTKHQLAFVAWPLHARNMKICCEIIKYHWYFSVCLTELNHQIKSDYVDIHPHIHSTDWAFFRYPLILRQISDPVVREMLESSMLMLLKPWLSRLDKHFVSFNSFSQPKSWNRFFHVC